MNANNYLEPSQEEPFTNERKSKDVEGHGELAQSRTAIWSVVGIIAFNALINIIFFFDFSVIISIIIDITLGIGLLRGKKWARTWTLIRVVLGLIIFGTIFIIQNNIPSAIVQITYCGAIIALLTGTSTRIRVGTSIALFFIIYIAVIAYSWIVGPTTYISSISEADSLTHINVGQEMTSTIDNYMDVDAFSFDAIKGQSFIIQTGTPAVTTPLADSLLTLWDSDGTTVLMSNDDYGDYLTSRIEWTADSTGLFYVTVENADAISTGDYTLIIELTTR